MTTKNTSRANRPEASAEGRDPLQPLFEELVEPTARQEFDSLRGRLTHLHHLRGSLSGSRETTAKQGANAMKSQWRKALTWTAAACLLLVIVACTVPMEYERETGLELAMTVSGNVHELVQEMRAQGWGVDHIQVTPLDENLQSLEVTLLGARESDLSTIRTMPGVVSMNAQALTETAEGTFYDMVMHEVFHISIDITGMSNEEIAAEVTRQLEASGLEGQVTVEATGDGLYNFEFNFEDDDSLPEGTTREFRIELQNGEASEGGLAGIGDLELDREMMDNMTPEQIDQFIREQLAAQGIDVDDVAVEVMADSTNTNGQVRQLREIRLTQ